MQMSFVFFGCYTATQHALQVQQERAQVVCSNKEARKLEGTLAMDHGLNGKHIVLYSNKRETERNTHQELWNMDEEHTL